MQTSPIWLVLLDQQSENEELWGKSNFDHRILVLPLFPVPPDKGNAGSGNEIGKEETYMRWSSAQTHLIIEWTYHEFT